MYSKAKIGNIPIHPMLVSFPLAFYTATLVGFIVYRSVGDPFWFRFAYIANMAGVVTAWVAAVPGLIDWSRGIPKYSEAKRTGFIHMFYHGIAFLFFTANLYLQYGKWDDIHPTAPFAIALSLVGWLFTLAAGLLGWKLTQTHHVGVNLTEKQESLEPTPTGGLFKTPTHRTTG